MDVLGAGLQPQASQEHLGQPVGLCVGGAGHVGELHVLTGAGCQYYFHE